MDALHEIELLWIAALQALGTSPVGVLRFISLFGNEEFYMLTMPLLYWCFDARFGLRVAMMLLLSNGVNLFGKLIFHSPRPYWLDAKVAGLSSETSFGLPSGHAQNAMAIFGLIAASLQRRWVTWAAGILIFLIGFSRIYLGVHFISDVVVGWLVGALLLMVFLRLEAGVTRWIQARSLRQLVAAAFVSSLGFVVVAVLLGSVAQQFPPLAGWEETARMASDEPIDPVNIDTGFTVAGTWFGMLACAAWLWRKRGGFDAGDGSIGQKVLRYGVGAVGVVVLWYGLGAIFPRNEDILSYALRYARYALVGGWVAGAAPLLFERLRLGRMKDG